jgi:hypothetical protein
MAISLHPDRDAVVSGDAVLFEARVSGAAQGALKLILSGPLGQKLPQDLVVQIGGNGKGRGTFAPVTFTSRSLAITTVICAAPDGSVAADVSVITIKGGR